MSKSVKHLVVAMVTGAATLAVSGTASAFFGFGDWFDGPGWGYPGYGWGGYPGYGWGGYPGYGWGGYPGYGWGGYPGYGWGGYAPYGYAPVAPAVPAASTTK